MAALIIVSILVVGGILALVVLSHHRGLKMTSMTEGRVLSTQVREIRTTSERRVETVIDCAYNVRGIDYQVQRVIEGRHDASYPPGKPVKIYYNPAEPQMSRVG